ncbi:hypothetical protein B0H19DRAFT_1373397 [Mycena capillaripes]|nr:hypothetical protein B0H19DRAFT_1373397 [Mycena capillaripes]
MNTCSASERDAGCCWHRRRRARSTGRCSDRNKDRRWWDTYMSIFEGLRAMLVVVIVVVVEDMLLDAEHDAGDDKRRVHARFHSAPCLTRSSLDSGMAMSALRVRLAAPSPVIAIIPPVQIRAKYFGVSQDSAWL